MTFKVMDRRCDQCLYGENKIVSDARRKQILKATVGNDSHFLCHKGTIVGQEICCKGDFDAQGGGKLGRFAKWLGVIEVVSADELEAKAKAKSAGTI